MTQYTFRMRDAYGDDYDLTVVADSEQAARDKAVMADDDANPGELLRTRVVPATW